MLILIIIFILPLFAFGVPPAPGPGSGLTYSRLNTTVTSDYAAVLASGEKIFIPSAEEIIPLAHPSQLPPAPAQYSTRRAARSPGVRCDTSSTSALYLDAQLVAVRISGVGSSWCCQTTPGAWACTRMGTYLTAEINICGPRDRCVLCGLIGTVVGEIVKGCRQASRTGDRTGGRFWYDQQTEVVVDHSYKDPTK